MGVFSEIDMEMEQNSTAEPEHVEPVEVSTDTIVEIAEQHDDARQEAEAKAAQEVLQQLNAADPGDAGKKAKEQASEDERRKAHEEAEAKRKAEWEAKQRAKKEAEQAAWENAVAMGDADVVKASLKRVGDDAERLTRRNMKQCVTEYIQTLCLENADFARQTMHPRKNMVRCFRYINRKAKEFIEQEMKDNDEQPQAGIYGSDVPDDLCYQWAVEYFWDMDAVEDKESEEKFVPKPYPGRAATKSPKKPEKKKSEAKKTPENAPQVDSKQISLFEVA